MANRPTGSPSPGSLHREAYTFDDNSWSINHFDHTFWAGAQYYGLARANNYSPMESFLFTFAASSFWEMFAEVREKVSLNDQVYTPIGGAIIGEVLHQVQGIFTRGSNRWTNRILGTIFGGPQAFNRWVSKNPPRRSDVLDRHGIAKDVWHAMALSLVRTDQPGTSVEVAAEVITIPGYSEPGQASQVVSSVPISQMLIRVGIDQTDLALYFKTALIGYYKKNLSEATPGRRNLGLNGYELFVGPSSAYTMTDRVHGDDLHEQFAAVSILGPTVDLTIYRGRLKMRAVIDVYGDFASIRSLALDEYLENHSNVGLTDSIRGHGYYFGYGGTANSNFVVNYRGLEVGGSYRVSRVESIEGHSRHQENVTTDLHFSDSRSELKYWMSFQPTRDWRVTGGVERLRLTGSIRDMDLRDSQTRTKMYGKLTLMF